MKNVSAKEQEKLLANTPWCCKKFYNLELAMTKEFGKYLLKRWHRDPYGYFSTLEGFVSSVATVIEMCGIDLDIPQFHDRANDYGEYNDFDPLNDFGIKYLRKIIKDAEKMINKGNV